MFETKYHKDEAIGHVLEIVCHAHLTKLVMVYSLGHLAIRLGHIILNLGHTHGLYSQPNGL